MLKKILFLILVVFGFVNLTDAADTNIVRTVIPVTTEGRDVDTNAMQQIYDAVKTPFKYGVVLQGASTNEYLDCPSVFRQGGRWYMMYVAITNKIGYQTFLARSDDLLHWKKLGKVHVLHPDQPVGCLAGRWRRFARGLSLGRHP